MFTFEVLAEENAPIWWICLQMSGEKKTTTYSYLNPPRVWNLSLLATKNRPRGRNMDDR